MPATPLPPGARGEFGVCEYTLDDPATLRSDCVDSRFVLSESSLRLANEDGRFNDLRDAMEEVFRFDNGGLGRADVGAGDFGTDDRVPEPGRGNVVVCVAIFGAMIYE